MQAARFLIEQGFSVEADDGRLLVSPADKLTDELRHWIRSHRDSLVAEIMTRATVDAPANDIPLSAKLRALGQPIALEVDGEAVCWLVSDEDARRRTDLNPRITGEEAELLVQFSGPEIRRLLDHKVGYEETIDAYIMEGDELHAQLAEIDENLCRHELTATQQAEHLQRRKEIWEAMRRQENSSGTSCPTGNVGYGKPPERPKEFAESTAESTGATKKSVNRATRRAREVCQQARGIIRNTNADTGVFLDDDYDMEPPAPVSVHCIDCKHFVRKDHPHLGYCAVGVKPEGAAGLWDTDKRLCRRFEPKENQE